MRDLPTSDFSGDDGAADPGLRRALSAAGAGAPTGPALAALVRSRLLVPVVAVPGDASATPVSQPSGGDGQPRPDKSADMAAVLITGRDGRRGLLAFTGADAMAAWDARARPVPVSAATAAQAAVAEGASALVVDVAGPATYVVEGADLRQTAAGSVLVRVGADYGWARRGGADPPADPPDGPADGAADGTTGPV